MSFTSYDQAVGVLLKKTNITVEDSFDLSKFCTYFASVIVKRGTRFSN